MSQEDICEFLKRNRGWWTAREIQVELGLAITSVSQAIKKLRYSDSVKYKRLKRGSNLTFVYKYKK